MTSEPDPGAPVPRRVDGPPLLALGAYDLGRLGCAVEEYFLEGEAVAYRPRDPLGADGAWAVREAGRAAYATRLVVVRPREAARFDGTVVVEWLNVTGGSDTPADWLMVHRELLRAGHAYVAVSAQKVGIDGGPSLGGGPPLRQADPGRYGGLLHPGDAFAFDLFSQAGRIARRAGPGGVLGGLAPARILAAGESQSAHFLTTYVNAIDPVARVFDGYLVHSRFAGSAPLDGGSILEGPREDVPAAVRFRTDLRVPVLAVIAEGDLLGTGRPGYLAARQPDAARLVVWEVAGAAHLDNYGLVVGAIDDGSAPLDALVDGYAPIAAPMGIALPRPINFSPHHHYVMQAALAALARWVRDGEAPPRAAPIRTLAGPPPALASDANGMAEGGVRTPWIDVPVARVTGGRNGESVVGGLFGTGEVFDAATLARLYPGGAADYLGRFEAALDGAIASGFLLAADRAEILALAGAIQARTAPLP